MPDTCTIKPSLSPKSPYATALWDYELGVYSDDTPLLLEDTLGNHDVMPVSVFFRTQLSDLDTVAINRCRGRVLDIGAGAGCMSLILQREKFKVTALDNNRHIYDLLTRRGVYDGVCHDIYDTPLAEKFTARTFDTLLVLMNGVGLAGTMDNLANFLKTLKRYLAPKGQILLDSTDIAYAYEGMDTPMGYKGGYYGEIQYRYHYKGTVGHWFPWLYIDFATLNAVATLCGFRCYKIHEDTAHDDGHYLVRLTVK